MSASEQEEQHVAANADLIEGLLGKAGYRRHWLADEFRSAANLALFKSARRFAGVADEEECRKYAATSIFHSFANVRKHYSRKRRKWAPLGEALDAGYHPESREVSPVSMAAIREELERDGPPKAGKYERKNRSWLSNEHRATLQAILTGDPGKNNFAVASEFFAATRIKIFPSSVRHLRSKLGLPPSKARGGYPCRALK